MPSPITKKTLEHLAALARLELDPKEEEKLLHDLQNILHYVGELQEVDTEHVSPMKGGTALEGVFREDDKTMNAPRGAGRDAFPETERGYLKTPPVFK